MPGDLSALQLLVPGAEVLLDAVRALPGVALLPPAHVSLGYPWLPADAARDAVERVAAAAASVGAYETALSGPSAFAPDARGRVLVHARLQDEEPVRRLARLLGADLREVHLSVARVGREGDVETVLAAVAPLLPRAVRLSTLELSVQQDRVWGVLLRADLARGAPPG